MSVKPTAVVLAGGQSRRFGANKLVAPFQGTTLLERVISVVKEVAEPVILSVSGAEAPTMLDLPVVIDRTAGLGPLSGLEAGLSVSSSEWTLFVAGDMPNLSSEVLTEIIQHGTPGIQAVVPRSSDGFIHPLCAVYHRSCLPVIQQAIWDQQYSLRSLVDRLTTFLLPVESNLMRNVNTQADLHRA